MKTITEQLVRKCFAYKVGWKAYAKAARKFVRLEQQQMSVDKLDAEIERLMRLANSKERKRNEND
jgi:hypothetical protein